MNTFTKKYLKFAVIIFFIGVVITIVAFSLGGKIIGLPSYDLTDITESYAEVESLNIDIDASDLEIKSGNEFKIVATDVSSDTFKSYVQNNKWYIQDKLQSRFFNFGNYHSKITIYIPSEFNLNTITIKMGAGKITADKLMANTTDIKVGAGDFRINNLTTDEIDIECGVGNVEINGIVNNKGDIESGVGQISLNLKGNEKDYNYNVSLGIGEVSLNGRSFSGMGKEIVNNASGNKSFNIESGIGKISLNIKE